MYLLKPGETRESKTFAVRSSPLSRYITYQSIAHITTYTLKQSQRVPNLAGCRLISRDHFLPVIKAIYFLCSTTTPFTQNLGYNSAYPTDAKRNQFKSRVLYLLTRPTSFVSGE